MTKQITLLLSLAGLIILVSCGQSEQQTEKEKQRVFEDQKKEQLKSKNEKAFVDLSLKFNAVAGWDTLHDFTVDLQQIFIDEHRPISFEGEIKDIVKVDSLYFVIVDSYSFRWSSTYLARIAITPEMFSNLKTQLKSKKNSQEGCFIFKVSKIISSSAQIKAEHESDGENIDSGLTTFEWTLS